MNGADVAAKRQQPGSAEKKTLALVAIEGVAQLLVDTELAHVGLSAPQAAMGEAVESHAAFCLDMGNRSSVGPNSWTISALPRSLMHFFVSP